MCYSMNSLYTEERANHFSSSFYIMLKCDRSIGLIRVTLSQNITLQNRSFILFYFVLLKKANAETSSTWTIIFKTCCCSYLTNYFKIEEDENCSVLDLYKSALLGKGPWYRLAVTVIVNDDFKICTGKYDARDPPNEHLRIFYQSLITIYSFFISAKK